MSILEESRQAKGGGVKRIFKNKFFYIFIFLIFIAGAGFYYFSQAENNVVSETVKKDWVVKKDDLQISFSGQGRVVAKNGVKLSFSLGSDNLQIKEVYVEQGDLVKQGDKIASVWTDDLEYELRKTETAYQAALANYKDRTAGPTEENITKSKASVSQAQLSLEQAQLSLEKTKFNAKEKIANAEKNIRQTYDDWKSYKSSIDDSELNKVYDSLVDNVKNFSITTNGILLDSDAILGLDNIYLNDDFEKYLGVKDLNSKNLAEGSYREAKNLAQKLESKIKNLSFGGERKDIEEATELVILLGDLLAKHLYYLQSMLENSITALNFAQSKLDSFVASVSSQRNNVNSRLSTLNNNFNNLTTTKKKLFDNQEDEEKKLKDLEEKYQTALENLETLKTETVQDVATAELNVRSRKLSLEQEENNHKNLFLPLSESELMSAQTSLSNTTIALRKAQNDLEKGILKSPIDGEIALLNYKVGDIILSGENKSVAEIINQDTLFVEANIEEADIGKIVIGQRVYVVFDALDGAKSQGEVDFISLTSLVNNNGVVTYLTRIILHKKEDLGIKEGMTASLQFITAEAKDVLIIPVGAVRNIQGKPSVQMKDAEYIPVLTGFTDGNYVEVLSALKTGDIIQY